MQVINTKKSFINIIWLSLDKLFRLGGNLLFIIWLARYLEPALFGVWSYAFAIVTIFGAFAPLGLDVIVVRELVKKDISPSKVLATALLLRLGFAVLLILTLLVTLFAFNIKSETVFNLCLIWSFIFIFQSLDIFDYFFQAINDVKQITFARLSGFTVIFIVKIYALIFHYSILFFGLLHLLEFVMTAFFLFIFYQKHANNQAIRLIDFRSKVANTLIKDGAFFMFANVSMLIHLRIDQVMLSYFTSDEVLGQYSAGVKISEILFHVPQIIAVVFFPKIIQQKAISPSAYFGGLERLYSALIWISILMLIFVLLFAEFLILNSFGANYAPAVSIIQIYIFTNLFANTSYITNRYLALENKTFITLYKMILAVCINILLNIWLIPNYGANGAAIASVVSYAFIGLAGDLLFVRNMAFLQVRSIPKIYFLFKYPKREQ